MHGRKSQYVYGPVPSRRLGRSLGVDLVPFKICTYDCIYCQLGRTTGKTVMRKEYVPVEAVLAELERTLAGCDRPDYISLAGSGEPTLNARIGEVIHRIKAMTSIPVAVLTNGSLLWIREVREALMEADLVLPSLDAGNERLFRHVNRPHEEILFDVMVDGLRVFTKRFPGQVWLEVFLLPGVTGVPSEVRRIGELVKRIQPALVQLNTTRRPPAEIFATPLAEEQMKALKRFFPMDVQIIAGTSGEEPQLLESNRIEADDIMALLARRPCTCDDVAVGLGVHVAEALKHLELLTTTGKATVVLDDGRAFYAVNRPDQGCTTMERYLESCRTEFWEKVFQAEQDYLIRHLKGRREVLSVGCGPAIIEGGLERSGFSVTGLDVSREALDRAPDGIRTVAGRAEEMPFPEGTFDAVIFVASLQFIENYTAALREAAKVLRPGGRIIVMLLNPRSGFVRQRLNDPDSYVQKLRHADLEEIEEVMNRDFDLRTEYFLGIDKGQICDASDPDQATLYVLRGEKRPVRLKEAVE